jgi:hypothetical protein
VTGSALERVILALEALAVEFVRIVATVVFVVTAPATRNTLAVATFEL